MIEILDCTLRDGGYYTNWDFDTNVTTIYFKNLDKLPIDYLEIGYRSITKDSYKGAYFYTPTYILEKIKQHTNKKLAIMINAKDFSKGDLEIQLKPCREHISMVRIATSPEDLDKSIYLAEKSKKMGFSVALNIMQMSKWNQISDILKWLPEINFVADYFYMVDSYGGIFPKDVIRIFELIKPLLNIKIGFHGHNNLELALVNSLTALECGANIVDSTILGMGRGAGNLKTELLLTTLQAQGKIKEFDYNALSKIVDIFYELNEKYRWGTNLPYMVSGISSLPQKEVMDWVGKRYYSLNSIIRALDNQSKGVEDNVRLSIFNVESLQTERVLLIGGGTSVRQHASSIVHFLSLHPEIVIIHASSKNAMIFKNIANKQIFCLVGNEGHRMEEVFAGDIPSGALCVLPPYPRKMGTYVPENLFESAYELENNGFTEQYIDSHTGLALNVILLLKPNQIYLAGYDGYDQNISEKDNELYQENQYLFEKFNTMFEKDLISITPTGYSKLYQNSVYSLINLP